MNNPTYVQDYSSIEGVLNKYIEGCVSIDSSILKPSFSEQATLFNADEEGKLFGGAIQDFYQTLDNDLPPSPDAKAVITYIDVVGTAASARIDWDDLVDGRYTDFFNLLKIDGQWIIIGKIYHGHA